MTLEYWIAVGIAVLALIILVAGSLIALKRIKNTLNNLQDFQVKTQQEMERYNSEADLINERVQKLNGRVTTLSKEAQNRADQFTDLSDRANELGHTLSVLNENKATLAKDVVKESGRQAKKQGPQMMKLLGKTLKKTFQKQKVRYIG